MRKTQRKIIKRVVLYVIEISLFTKTLTLIFSTDTTNFLKVTSPMNLLELKHSQCVFYQTIFISDKTLLLMF
jgi:hypothetical protein